MLRAIESKCNCCLSLTPPSVLQLPVVSVAQQQRAHASAARHWQNVRALLRDMRVLVRVTPALCQDCALRAAARRQQNQCSASGDRPSIASFISLTVCLTRSCPRSPSANSASSSPSIWTATPFKSFLTKYFCSLHSRCPRCSAPHAARLRRPHCLPGTMAARQRHRSYSAQRCRPHQPHHAHSVEQSGVLSVERRARRRLL